MPSEAQGRFYEDNGYLPVEDVLEPGEAARLRAAVDDLIERSRGETASGAAYMLGEGHRADGPRLRRVTDPEKHHEAFEAPRRHAGVLDVVESLLGPDIRFDHGKLDIETPSVGDAAIEWRQDRAFYPHTDGDMLAVGVCLDDRGEENEPLLAIPGSHKGPILEHNDNGRFLGATDIREAGLDNAMAVSPLGRAGSIALHRVRTPRASRPNTGDRPRLPMPDSYKAADCWPLMGVQDLDWCHGCMARGETSWTPRMEALPADLGRVGLFTTQEPVRGRSFGDEPAVAAAARRPFDTPTRGGRLRVRRRLGEGQEALIPSRRSRAVSRDAPAFKAPAASTDSRTRGRRPPRPRRCGTRWGRRRCARRSEGPWARRSHRAPTAPRAPDSAT